MDTFARKRFALTAIAAGVAGNLALATPALAQTGPVPAVQTTTAPGYQTHDGFYLRFVLGPGYTTMSSGESSSKLKVNGGGAGFSVAAGGAIAPNVVLFGEIVSNRAMNPDVSVGSGTGTLRDASAGLIGVGGGAALYLMPANIYLSGALTLTKLTLDDKDGKTINETSYGPGLDLTVGKEWWVSANWGLGVAAQLALATMKDKGPSPAPTWTAVGATIAFSATFN
jgi:hypothetical protein